MIGFHFHSSWFLVSTEVTRDVFGAQRANSNSLQISD